MVKSWAWTINIFILILLLSAVWVIYSLTMQEQRFMLNCSSELSNQSQQEDSGAHHYLLVDLVAAGKNAQINYRYFNLDGSSAGSISMTGKVVKVDEGSDIYHVSVDTKQELASGDMPQHMQYVSYVSSLNLNSSGMHNLSLELLDIDKAKDYAVVLFKPSNTVCGCRLVHLTSSI